MSTEKAAASRQQDRLPEDIAMPGDDCILTESNAVVKNKLLTLRTASGANVADMVEKVKKLYPGYDRYLHSKCENGERYGIDLRPDAMKLLENFYGTEAKRNHSNRKKPRRLYARVTDTVYGILKRECERRKENMQDMLERIILNYIAEKGL